MIAYRTGRPVLLVAAVAAVLVTRFGPAWGAQTLNPLSVGGRAPPAAAANAPESPLPPGGASLLPNDALSAFTIAGQGERVEMTRVPVAGQPFGDALRLRTRPGAPFPNIYAAQIQATPSAGVKKGDVLLATFYVRGVEGGQPETGETQTEFVFERAGEPYTKSAEKNIAMPRGGEWRQINLPFTAAEDLAPGQAHVSFRLGYPAQVFELGGFRLLNYENRVALKDLPRTPVTYAGREPDAAWRKAAQARIRKIRMADLTVRVVDGKGKPVKNAVVAVRMKRHAFPFGSAVAAEMLLADTPDARRYQQMVPRLFNRVVMENDLKWPQWEENPDRAKRGVAWLRAKNIEVRGHTLIWPSWRNSPRDLQSLAGDKTALARRIRDHITNEATAMRGQLVEWDVVNEPFDNHDVTDILGRDSLKEWFRLARAADPEPTLFLNDYPPLDGAAVGNPHLNAFEQNIRFLKDGGAPIGGIGFQGHFGGSLIPPARVVSGLDRFSKFGLPIAITEFDVNTDDEQIQADYLRDFFTAAFSHPAVNSIILWGFWEGRHWLPAAALWRRDWTIKPNGQAYTDLVLRDWWTNADGKTGAAGNYAVRGFLGDYVVTVSAGGKKTSVPMRLTSRSAPLRVTLR
jgi:GH35 family endo-1,4-beta-xylanase